MTSPYLRTYLSDHLAFITAECELVARCRRNQRSGPLGDFLQTLENEVSAQRTIVRDVLNRMFGSESWESRLKESAGWLAEKLGRFKRNGHWVTYSALSRVLELEVLTSAAVQRIALWESMMVIAEITPQLSGLSFDFFREQAVAHRDELESRRRFAAAEAFTPPNTAKRP